MDSTSFNAKIFNKLKVERRKNIKSNVWLEMNKMKKKKIDDEKISVLAHFVSKYVRKNSIAVKAIAMH